MLLYDLRCASWKVDLDQTQQELF